MTHQIATSENRDKPNNITREFYPVFRITKTMFILDSVHIGNMDQGQIIGLKKKLKKNNDDALDFVQKLESTITDFEKTGNLSGSYSEIKKAILEYKDKLLN